MSKKILDVMFLSQQIEKVMSPMVDEGKYPPHHKIILLPEALQFNSKVMELKT